MSWSDYGDWTSADTLRLNPYLKSGEEAGGCVEALIRAVNEREEVAGRTKIFVDSEGNLTCRLFDIEYIKKVIHDEITALLTLFVNHLDHGGDWTGQTTIPNWTEPTILAAIGASGRVARPSFYVSAEWVFQSFQILKMLRWNKRTGVNGIESIKVGYGDGYSLEDAVNAAISNMSLDGLEIRQDTGVRKYISVSGEDAGRLVYTGAAASGQKEFHSGLVPALFAHYGDFYIGTKDLNYTPPRQWEFDNNSLLLQKNALSLYSSFEESYNTNSVTVGDANSLPPVYPPEPSGLEIGDGYSLTRTYATARGWYLDYASAFFVMKFDGPNGFEFLD